MQDLWGWVRQGTREVGSSRGAQRALGPHPRGLRQGPRHSLQRRSQRPLLGPRWMSRSPPMPSTSIWAGAQEDMEKVAGIDNKIDLTPLHRLPAGTGSLGPSPFALLSISSRVAEYCTAMRLTVRVNYDLAQNKGMCTKSGWQSVQCRELTADEVGQGWGKSNQIKGFPMCQYTSP